MMDTYALRSAIREWEQGEGEQILEFPYRKELEDKLFELDRCKQLTHNYRAVLADILS